MLSLIGSDVHIRAMWVRAQTSSAPPLRAPPVRSADGRAGALIEPDILQRAAWLSRSLQRATALVLIQFVVDQTQTEGGCPVPPVELTGNLTDF